MKRYFVILALITISQTGFSQTMNQLFDSFSKQDHVTKVTMGKFIMKLSSVFTETMGVDGIEVLDLDECGEKVKKNFSNAIRDLKDPTFETMVTSNEKDSRTKVMIRIDKEMIRELVVLTTGKDNALIRIKGKIKPSDIEKVVKNHGNGC